MRGARKYILLGPGIGAGMGQRVTVLNGLPIHRTYLLLSSQGPINRDGCQTENSYESYDMIHQKAKSGPHKQVQLPLEISAG